MSIKESITDIYNKIYSGQLLEAFEEYYAEEVVMQENEEAPRVGKAVNREFEQNFLKGVAEWHGGGVNSICVDEEKNVSMVESWMEISFQGAPQPMRMQQIARQQWKDGKIVHEKFYYNKPNP